MRILGNLDNSKGGVVGFVIDGIPKWSELDSELGYVLKIINTHSSAVYLSDLRQDISIILRK